MITKITKFVKENRGEIILFISVVLVSMFSFSLGYIVSKMEDTEPLYFEEPLSSCYFKTQA